MITNDKKQELCEKYDIYLRVIDKVGNKIMLQQHFVELALELNIEKDKFKIVRALLELENGEIIKKIKFSNTNNKFIIFKKYAIRYLANANSSKAVSAVSKVNSNKKYYDNIFKTKFILTSIIPSMKKRNLIIDFDGLLKFLEDINCNILYSKNHIDDYYKRIGMGLKDYIDTQEFAYDLNILVSERETRLKNLKGVEVQKLKTNKRSKEDSLYNSTIATLVRKNIYIAELRYSIKDNCLKISAYYLNSTNNQSAYNIALNYSICYNVLRKIFNCEIKLFFKVAVSNETTKNNLQHELNRRVINPVTKELRDDNYLIELLKANNLSEIDFSKMTISLISYSL
ncbi:hypothetical protein [Clostridium sporogenes]|nr:hypothetical protein [Clostridium sporogenes]MCF4018728.1 hypothetical protein [Clostridium sporogenes]